MTLLLARLTKVATGDNLSPQINTSVLAVCGYNDISFIALPPNSTHLAHALLKLENK